ncbi:DUF6528 family protein [Streptomyces sp. NRRL B-24572]|uniref:DUF6528 family protein n=1 Tax=Streptomyces sp. NRRL B-24572 TaxID=1962156 RepID=UPI0015C51D6E|nr:DUF6528 family protein [Streptomyces sp. NRRL B-24572]
MGAGLTASLVTAPSGGDGADASAPAPEAAAYTVTPAVSPFVQSGPRNIITRVQDTYVSNVDSADHSTEHLLRLGTPDNGTTRYRSFLKFDVSKLNGADIKSASLRMYNSDTGSCDGYWMYANPVAAAWDPSAITWANQPALVTGYETSAKFGLGSAACPDRPVDSDPDTSNAIKRIDLTATVKAWTRMQDRLPNNGLRLSAGELGSVAYKELCSMNPAASDPACHLSYYTPTLEVEFNPGAPVISAGDQYAVNYGGYPATSSALEFYDSSNPSLWPATGPYQRWVPDAYHSFKDPYGDLLRGAFAGGTEHKLRPAGEYTAPGRTDEQVLVVGDGQSGLVAVVPYPALSGARFAINVGTQAVTNLHGVELMPDGNVAVALTRTHQVKVYTKAQGAIGNAPSAYATPADTKTLEEAHSLLYDKDTDSLWAIGKNELVRYPYTLGTGKLGEPETFAIPLNANGYSSPYGHDIQPVYGNPDRLWVSANAGIVQFSKSGAASCYKTSRWPTPTAMEHGEPNRWCTDYDYEGLVNKGGMAKSVGNDPVSGRVITTCAEDATACDPSVSGAALWTTPAITFIDTTIDVDPDVDNEASRHNEYWRKTNAQYYRARWMVPSYN